MPNEGDSGLSDQKLAAEIEKLRLENQSLKRPAWRNSTVLIAAGGLALSLLTNLNQCSTAKRASEDASMQFTAAQTRWATEKVKIELEVAVLKQKAGLTEEIIREVGAELEKVNSEIKVWDTWIFKDQMELKLEEAQLDRYLQAKRTEMAKAGKQDVKNLKESIEYRTGERAALISRRSELEKRLGNAQ